MSQRRRSRVARSPEQAPGGGPGGADGDHHRPRQAHCPHRSGRSVDPRPADRRGRVSARRSVRSGRPAGPIKSDRDTVSDLVARAASVIGYLDSSVLVPCALRRGDERARARRSGTASTTSLESAAPTSSAPPRCRSAAVQPGSRADQHRRGPDDSTTYWTETRRHRQRCALVARAAQLGHCDLALRAYDAVHAASAESIGDQDLVAAAGDRQLLAAWSALGIATFDPYERA